MVGGLGRNRDRRSAVSRPPMTSYYRGQTKTTSPFAKKAPAKVRGAFLTKLVDGLLIVVLVFCLIYSLIVRPDPRVIASSNEYRTSNVYRSAAAQAMQGFKDRSKLTFNESALVTDLKTRFPEISVANVELPLFGQRPIIRLSIAAPEFLFASQGHLYLIAANGVVVSDNPKITAAKNLPVVTDQTGFTAKLGQPVLSTDEVSFISQLVKQCHRAKVPIKSLVLPNSGQELDLRTKDKSYYVKFYLGGDPMVETGQFLAARAEFTRDHKSPVQYLDVRVGGKIYYK